MINLLGYWVNYKSVAGKTSQENGKKGGRPIASKTLIAQKIKDRMAQKLYERIDPIIDAMLDKAEGGLLEVSADGGKSYQTRIDNWYKKAEEDFDFAETARKEFDAGSPQKKREILSSLGYNLFLKGKKLNIEWPKLFLVLKKMVVNHIKLG